MSYLLNIGNIRDFLNADEVVIRFKTRREVDEFAVDFRAFIEREGEMSLVEFFKLLRDGYDYVIQIDHLTEDDLKVHSYGWTEMEAKDWYIEEDDDNGSWMFCIPGVVPVNTKESMIREVVKKAASVPVTYEENLFDFIDCPEFVFETRTAMEKVISAAQKKIYEYGFLSIRSLAEIVEKVTNTCVHFNPGNAPIYSLVVNGWRSLDGCTRGKVDGGYSFSLPRPDCFGGKPEEVVSHDEVFLHFFNEPRLTFYDPSIALHIFNDMDIRIRNQGYVSIRDLFDSVIKELGYVIGFESPYSPRIARDHGWISVKAFSIEVDKSGHATLVLPAPVSLIYEKYHIREEETIMSSDTNCRCVMTDCCSATPTPRHSGRYPWTHIYLTGSPLPIPAIESIHTYNDRVVLVRFADGTSTKSVCMGADIFDVDTGITICLMKRMLSRDAHEATKRYNDLIRSAHKAEERRQKALEDYRLAKIEARRKDDARKAKAAAKKARKNAEMRENIAEAIRASRTSGITLEFAGGTEDEGDSE